MSTPPEPVFAVPASYNHSLRNDASSRRRHICLLNDLLHLSIERSEWDKAARAWAILARCPEVDWKEMAKVGLILIGKRDGGTDDGDEPREDFGAQRIDYLKSLMLRNPEKRETILRETVLEMIALKRYRDALDELTLYLPSFPFHDNPVLHLYAGMVSLYLAQAPKNSRPTTQRVSGDSSSDEDSMSHAENRPTVEASPLNLGTFNPNLVRAAHGYFERALLLDPDNDGAKGFLALLDNSPFVSAASRRLKASNLAIDDDDDQLQVIAHKSEGDLLSPPAEPPNADDDVDEAERNALSKRVRLST